MYVYMNTVRLLMFIVAFSFYSCSGHQTATVELEELPLIFPDYKNVVVPPNIAPLNFMVEGAENVRADFGVEEGKCFSVTGNEGIVKVPVYQWEGLLKSAVGKKIQVRNKG